MSVCLVTITICLAARKVLQNQHYKHTARAHSQYCELSLERLKKVRGLDSVSENTISDTKPPRTNNVVNVRPCFNRLIKKHPKYKLESMENNYIQSPTEATHLLHAATRWHALLQTSIIQTLGPEVVSKTAFKVDTVSYPYI